LNRLHLFTPGPRPEPDLVERYRRLSTPLITDSMERSQGAIGLLPVGECLSNLDQPVMAGPAFTVRTRPGDNLVVHKALDLARPGDVLVVDARGEVTNAILGELMTLYARQRGLAGIVVDGAIRDFDRLSAGILPVFARGVSHLGPYKSGPGEIHGPVQIGGVAVSDGDLVVGDADGVAVVPRSRAEETLCRSEALAASEEESRAEIAQGNWDRSWIERLLEVVEPDSE
jgi:regulator of RNase E activity RraA